MNQMLSIARIYREKNKLTLYMYISIMLFYEIQVAIFYQDKISYMYDKIYFKLCFLHLF